MIEAMGNCLPWLGSSSKRKVSLLMVGLDNAGKTTAVKGVQRHNVQDVTPTVGFSSVELKTGKHDVAIIDLGGGSRIRGIWKNYMAEVHGVIYVVDSSDSERMAESKEALHALLSNPLVQKKPVLLLANKQDKPDALSEYDICEKLDLERTVNDNQCLCRVVLCAVITSRPGRNGIDRALKDGYLWLLHVIDQQYETLNERVADDLRKRNIKEKEDRAARDERVARAREERAKREAEESNVQVANSAGSHGDVTATYTHHSDVTAADNLALPGAVRDERVNASAQSVRSGLGDQLMDDDGDDDALANGDVAANKQAEDSCTESQQRSASRASEIVRDTPTLPPTVETPKPDEAAPHSESALDDEASNETESTITEQPVAGKKRRRKKRKSNKVAPIINEQLPLSAVVLAPIKSKSLPGPVEGILDHAPLPPLKSLKPNVDSEDDIPV